MLYKKSSPITSALIQHMLEIMPITDGMNLYSLAFLLSSTSAKRVLTAAIFLACIAESTLERDVYKSTSCAD